MDNTMKGHEKLCQKMGVRSCVHFCLRSHLTSERCAVFDNFDVSQKVAFGSDTSNKMDHTTMGNGMKN